MIVNILGKGDGWNELPENPEGLVYGVNDAFIRNPRVTHTFHMHDLNEWEKREGAESSTKLVAEHAKDRPDMEFFTVKPYKKIPNAKVYPLEEIVEHFGTNYFTNGISYMIAYALWKGATQLNLYGVNMTVKEEYIAQKPNVEYWIGRAQGMGVKVNFQWRYTSLLKSKDGLIYGWFIDQWKVEDK